MAARATINQRVQIGDESTPGTGVSADKVINCFDISVGAKPDVATFRGTGRRFTSQTELNREWSEGKISGNLDYQGIAYLASGVWGYTAPVTHAGGTLSKDWTWTPPLTGSITPRTYTIEKGDATRAEKVTYGLITGFSYKGTRSDFTCEASYIARRLDTSATMTASPTSITLAPVVGQHVNLYVDATSAGLGTTQYMGAFSVEFSYDSAYGPTWPLDRAQASFTEHVDTAPKSQLKMRLMADATGMAVITTYLRLNATVYIRVDAEGPVIELAIPYKITHDMAAKVVDVSEFSDENGVYAIDYTCEIVEDSSWGSGGKAQTMTVTNQISAL